MTNTDKKQAEKLSVGITLLARNPSDHEQIAEYVSNMISGIVEMHEERRESRADSTLFAEVVATVLSNLWNDAIDYAITKSAMRIKHANAMADEIRNTDSETH